jgi:radical SAM superfamily enzyme YgiQ (UPF0313 family)
MNRKLKILLCSAPDAQVFKGYFPPLGLLYLASYLEKHGYEVCISDAYAQHYTIEEIVAQAKRFAPEVIGITSSTSLRFTAIELIKKLKQETGALLLVGGQHFSPTAVDALKLIPQLDVVVKQEGEETTLELLRRYFAGDPL